MFVMSRKNRAYVQHPPSDEIVRSVRGVNLHSCRPDGDMTRQAGGNLAKAETDLTTAITLDPQDAEAYEQRGIVMIRVRRGSFYRLINHVLPRRGHNISRTA